ncbi:MAG: efflux RND transporter permease subunit [Thermoanaerobaculales bacterium]|jgi:multidrug efflux pump subunit AcrB|nr:efflux RND transporter permease subunit [Thermoanaerobaculales bacterium]
MTDETPTGTASGEGKPTPLELEQARREALRLKMTRRKLGLAGRVGRAFLESKLTPLIVVGSLLLGAFAIMVTPSEEEPQIKVPMIDVMVGFPGATAEEIEHRVITPLEKLLYEIENVEYIYSTSQPSGGLIVVRFLVGSDPDRAANRVHTKILSAMDEMPEGLAQPLVKPRTIDDVPVVAYTLWSETATSTELRRVADELKVEITKHPRAAQVWVTGGQRRVVRADFDRERLASYNVSLLQAYQALESANRRLPAGATAVANTEVLVDVGGFLTDADEVGNVVVGAYGGRPVYLKDVATITDGPEEPSSYVWLGTGPGAPEKGIERAGLDLPAVTVSVAKKPGTNAVDMVHDLDRVLARLEGRIIPSDVELLKTRDYGETAKEKSDELLTHLWSATLAVILLMWITLSRREAVVVAVVIPVTLALTLAASYFFGYTLNRVSLFALVFSIGILVDDAIVVVENIHRHIKLRWGKIKQATVYAVDEVGNPTILATFAIISALLPLAFVRGLMGPYMRPIPINASAAMLFSLGVAFTISPWLAYRLFKKEAESAELDKDSPPEDTGLPEEGRISRLYGAAMRPLIRSGIWRTVFLAGVALLLVAAMATVGVGFTTVKMLPHDNKSELQVVIDAPEGFTLEQTNAAAREIAGVFRSMPEVTDYQVYVGTSAPFNFNGLVRHYFLRSGANVADIQVNFVHKEKRDLQSHDLAKKVREMIVPVAEPLGVTLKVTEIPPGPPVMSTLVAEVYGPTLDGRLKVAEQVKEVFATTDGVVDVDWEVEAVGPKLDVVIDREKAIRAGVTVEQVARTVRVALSGADAGLLHAPTSREPVPIRLRLDRAQRAHIDDLLQLSVHGAGGRMVPLSEIAHVEDVQRERNRYHKNLQPVTYVYGEVANRFEAPVYAIFEMQQRLEEILTPHGEPLEIIATTLPEDSTRYIMKWDGEWHITYEVFRDMGIAFAVVMVLIYVLMVGWFKSFITPVIIMVPIPLTLVGILPAHGIFSVFFTATSMIGFIALAGIIVRNSILLVDFINLELRAGEPLEEAVVKAGGVRLVPILLTQLSTIAGASFMLSDPIFQGLALAMISGIIVSTALTVGVIPVLYFMYLKTVGVENVVEID